MDPLHKQTQSNDKTLSDKELYYRSLEPQQPLVLLVGPPLSGKSQVSGVLTHYFENLSHVSLSHEIRSFLRREVTLIPAISEPKREKYLSYLSAMNEGVLIPDEKFVFERVLECLKQHPRGIVLDGFPRNEAQVRLLEKLTTNWKTTPVVFSVDFDHDNLTEVNRRLLKRINESSQSGEVRLDDSWAIITENRIPNYEQHTKPILPILERLVGPDNFRYISSAVGNRDPKDVEREAVSSVKGLGKAFFQPKKRQ